MISDTTFSKYWRLMRFDKPVGILLLWIPTAWALWLANKGVPSLKLSVLFLCGTVLMRSAGCVLNDIVDRNIDKYVARTKLRPLASGELKVPNAFFILLLLLLAALVVLIQLPLNCFYLGLIALFISACYPFCKRFLDAPQLVLGIAFSMGIPMAYVASGTALNSEFLLLFAINFFWILAYDTMYAMTDKADDLKINVRSTAIYFASYDRCIIGLLQCLFHSLWLYWGILAHVSFWFYFLWILAGLILIYQQILIYYRKPQQCFKAFLVSAYYGLLMWFAVCIRDVPLNKDARLALFNMDYTIHAGSDVFIFIGQRGVLSTRGVQLMLKRLKFPEEVGVISPHQLRHTFCKNLVDVGVSLEKVASLAGHERLDTTKLYCQPSFADLSEAVERIGEND